jgi:Kdo2-lipid IVA lauroyltransferase/acyltransferase
MNKDALKKMKRALARWAFYFFFWLFGRLPYGLVKAMSDSLIFMAFLLVKKMRKIAKESLTIAFGKEKTEAEIDAIIRRCFFNLGRCGIEMLYFTQRPAMITEKLSFAPGARDRLEEALKQGKGVIAVTAHFGNFPLMLLFFAQMGYKTNAIIRPARDEKIEKTFQAMRTKLGLNTIYSYPRVECVKESLKALRQNEIVCIPLDQNFGTGGVYVDFFGQRAATATGTVIFAMRTGAVILPVFIARSEGDNHTIMAEPYFELEYKDQDQATIEHNVAKITKIIEGYVRKFPYEWGWMHRRWKSKQKEGE